MNTSVSAVDCCVLNEKKFLVGNPTDMSGTTACTYHVSWLMARIRGRQQTTDLQKLMIMAIIGDHVVA